MQCGCHGNHSLHWKEGYYEYDEMCDVYNKNSDLLIIIIK